MATDPKKTTETATTVNVYSAIYDIANSADFEREATGYAPYWKPAMFCTKCKPLPGKGEPGRKLGDREFACEQADSDNEKPHGKAFLVGSAFVGRVMARDSKPQIDERSGEVKDFIRWLLVATRADVPCFQGPTNEVERMTVRPNEPFNVSNYETLKFEDLLGCEIAVIAKSKRALKEGRTLWNFDLRIPKDMKRELDAARLAAAENARKQIQALAYERMTKLMGEAKPTGIPAVPVEQTQPAAE